MSFLVTLVFYDPVLNKNKWNGETQNDVKHKRLKLNILNVK